MIKINYSLKVDIFISVLKKTIFFLAMWLFITFSPNNCSLASAQDKLIIGTKAVPPFAIKDSTGTWSGISIDLWREIAKELNIPYEFEEFSLNDLLLNVKQGNIDFGIAAISITAERENNVNFTNPYFTAGLGIAVPQDKKSNWLSVIKRILSPTFLKIVTVLTFILFFVGFLAWLFEKKRNPQQFESKALKGIGSGFWWAAVTMTTVGYGDKAPVTFAGRILAILWMFTTIIILSSLTAAITSALTVSELNVTVQSVKDLPKVRVATVAGSTSETYLREKDISFETFTTDHEGLQAVAEGRFEAMVYDAPLLQYMSKTRFNGKIEVLSQLFEFQYYAFVLPENSSYREAINRILLKKITQPVWPDILFRYLGN